ncbi:MAG: polyprenyl synthetase family protein [Actinomycetota bacterium]
MASNELSELRASINSVLDDFTKARSRALTDIGSELQPVASAMSEFITDGGKRFRPIFAYLGYLGTGAAPRHEIVRACTALELVHVCALIHDDVMDGSDTRRNKPAIHKLFQSLHDDQSYEGNSERFGLASAILLGDLALVWADRLLVESGISREEFISAQEVFSDMRDELMAGQYLDVLEGALATTSVERSLKVARFKSGKYSIERPLHFGAALAGKPDFNDMYSRFGLPLGEAFQLRDDLLGVFGDPKITGKPAGDDIREGKRTVLIAITMENADQSQRNTMTSALGNSQLSEDDVAQVQEIIVKTGARDDVEKLITDLTQESISALRQSPIDEKIRSVLEEMSVIATQRSV